MNVTQREVQIRDTPVSYVLERKPVKAMRMRVRRDGSVYVSAPAFVPVDEIDAFVLENGDAVLKEVVRRQTALQKEKRSFCSGGVVFVLGRAVRIEVEQGRRKGASIENGILQLRVKGTPDPKKVEKLAKEYLCSVAEHVFASVLDRIYPTFLSMGVKKPQLRLREMKSLHGSCAVKKGIVTLNKRLLEKPIICIEYVVAHELCHFIHPNHSKRFYALLESVMPDHKERKKLLNQ